MLNYAFAFSGLLAIATANSPTAIIDSGAIIGTTTSLPAATATVNQYFGIPFAISPPGRFELPQEPEEWDEPLHAQARKPVCIQQFQYPDQRQNFTKLVFNNPFNSTAPEESEDCLYLNVFAPGGKRYGRRLPVLYWIYGGGGQFGGGSLSAYDGSHFAAYEDVIVVTANYRTNVFGWPASPEIPIKERNIALYDTRFALEWVQRNIHAFGGDPDQVTIFGESHGGYQVGALVTSYDTDTAPFRAGILQSGQESYPPAKRPSPEDREKIFQNLTTELGCDRSSIAESFACVKAAPAADLKRVQEIRMLDFGPINDNVTQITAPAKARLAGNIARVPILIGSNQDEGTTFTRGMNSSTVLDMQFPDMPKMQAAIRARYQIGQPGIETDADVTNRIYTDVGFTCPAARIANDSLAAGIPAWRYFYNATFPGISFPDIDLGAYHSSEIPLIFSTYPPVNVTTQQYALSISMRGAWAAFARNPHAGPGWNAVGSGSRFANPDGGPGAADADVGVLGRMGSAGVEVLPRSVVDARCDLYDGLFDEVSSGPGA